MCCSDACPNPQAGQTRSGTMQTSNYTCFLCNQPGHLSTSCPKSNGGGGGGNGESGGSGDCFHCGKTGECVG